MAWIRKYYGVPAKRGGRVRYAGHMVSGPALGTITSAKDGKLNIRLDGHPHPYRFHPTWCLEYLEGAA